MALEMSSETAALTPCDFRADLAAKSRAASSPTISTVRIATIDRLCLNFCYHVTRGCKLLNSAD